MSMPPNPSDALDPALLSQAATWLVRLREGESDSLYRDIECWYSQSPAHAAAWERAQAVMASFQLVPGQFARRTLGQLSSARRRRALHALGLAAIGVPAAWMVWRHSPWDMQADLRTATGEQKLVPLADGGRLVLNTASAVDIAFSETERRIVLHRGEILVTTGKDNGIVPRPFIVATRHGVLRPLGTRFSVRNTDRVTQLSVFEGAVEIQTEGGGKAVLISGRKTTFSYRAIAADEPIGVGDDLWERGMLVADAMPLRDLLAELGRYRSGYLGCTDAVAELPVSGAFPLGDTNAALALLLKTRPLAMRSVTPYWIRLEEHP